MGISYADLLPGRWTVAVQKYDGAPAIVGAVGMVDKVSREFLAQVAKDLDVQSWLISTSDKDKTRGEYLEHLTRFLAWAGWTPGKIWELKREAMKLGDPQSQVEVQIRRYHEALRQMGYAGKTTANYVAAIYSFIASKGYNIPRKLVRVNTANKLMMRVPERLEVELFIQYSGNLDRKLLYTLMVDTPCRPRVHVSLRWNWLEEKWWEKDIVNVALPKEFRPESQGPRKFEPICFLGPKSIELMKQVREARRIRNGEVPAQNDRILPYTQDAGQIAVSRDFNHLTQLGLIRPSRTDEHNNPIEQPISPKSWRKYQFNVIDSLVDISPEWRKMLKGRDLQTERYYSKENIEALRNIYRTKIQPALWPDTAAASESEQVRALREELESVKLTVRMLSDASGLKVVQHA